MSPYLPQMRILSENINNTAQNPCAKSRTVSTPLCKIETSGNHLAPKPEDAFLLCIENMNSFTTSNTRCHSDKVKRMKHISSRLNAVLISLAETQINPSLVTNKNSLNNSLFTNQHVMSILSNNKNELIGRLQQGGVMAAVRVELAKFTCSTGEDPTGIGRWNYVNVSNGAHKCRLVLAYQSLR